VRDFMETPSAQGPSAGPGSIRGPGLAYRSPVFWSACDLAVLTSDNEVMPFSLIEAGLAGLAAVTTDAGSASEVVVDGVTGLVLAKDPGAVA
jgi:glycosyltransferase involved in cell wall biosynthesis